MDVTGNSEKWQGETESRGVGNDECLLYEQTFGYCEGKQHEREDTTLNCFKVNIARTPVKVT